jgi:hypothetical protein
LAQAFDNQALTGLDTGIIFVFFVHWPTLLAAGIREELETESER